MAKPKKPVVGERKTGQRDAILAVISRSKGPLTVNQIHSRARRSIPTLGIATVYRAVKLLLDAKLIQSVVLPDGQMRYEDADLGHHHHFRCRKCDSVFDLEFCPLSLPQGTTFPGGFLVEDHELTLYGVCPNCRKKK